MLNRKMDAVKCIVSKSEEYAEEFHRNDMLQKNFTYYSSKYSIVRKLLWSDAWAVQYNVMSPTGQ